MRLLTISDLNDRSFTVDLDRLAAFYWHEPVVDGLFESATLYFDGPVWDLRVSGRVAAHIYDKLNGYPDWTMEELQQQVKESS